MTGAFVWKGKFDTLPAVASYEAGNVIGVGNKEYVLTVTGDTKAWVEFGDEGSYLLKSTAESTYLKKNDASTTYAPKSHTHTKSQITDFPTIPTVNDAKVTIKMNGSEKGNFTLNQSSTKEIDLGTVITQHQDISGKLDKAKLTPILKEIDLTGTDAERKAKLDQFEKDWKALTGSDTLKGARFVGKSVVPDDGEPLVGVFSFSSSSYCEGMLYASAYTPYKAELTIDGSLTITPLFQHLEAVVLRISDGDSNADTVNAANKTSIENYVANLQSLGVSIEGTPCHFRLLKYKNGNYTNYAVNVGILKLTEKYGQYDFWIDGVKGSVDYDTGKVTISFNLNTILKAIRHGFEAITIYTDNTDEHMQANLDNIAAYEANLQALRVDVTKGFSIPVYIDGNGLGFLCKPGDVIYYMGVMNYYGSSSFGISIDAMGTYYSYKLQTETNNSLTTTSKQIVDAINEVNAAVKTKANSSDVSSKQDKLVSGTNIKTVNGTSLLGSGDITVSGEKKEVTIPITGVETTLTSIQVTAFKDPNTNIIISMDAGVLPTDIYSYDDSGNVVYRVYAGTLLAASGVAFMQFRVEDSKLIYTFANLSANTPVNDTDVANKKYVDDKFASASGGGSGSATELHASIAAGETPFDIKLNEDDTTIAVEYENGGVYRGAGMVFTKFGSASSDGDSSHAAYITNICGKGITIKTKEFDGSVTDKTDITGNGITTGCIYLSSEILEGNQAVNKKYVDDQITAKLGTVLTQLQSI